MNLSQGANTFRMIGDGGQSVTGGNDQYYSDADGVVRRASGGYSLAPGTPLSTGTGTTYTNYNGLPMQTASVFSSGSCKPQNYSSRPLVLNRPFRTVGELGYTFSGTPWKNIDFFTPESGYAALLDVFCTNDSGDSNGRVAGKVNLNTLQAPVLQALLAGAYKDELNLSAGTTITGANEALGLAADATNGLITRTSSTIAPRGPLANVTELVGKWIAGTGTTAPIDGVAAFSGFSADLNNIAAITSATPRIDLLQRFHEAAIRALSNTGQTRVWNLLIDIVAQSGRYPTSASGLDKFMVEGEQHYWVHVALDRYTGQIIDKQIEVVKE